MSLRDGENHMSGYAYDEADEAAPLGELREDVDVEELPGAAPVGDDGGRDHRAGEDRVEG